MPLSPQLYHWFIRPQYFTKKYIHNPINRYFTLNNKSVLDFGCGTGANCRICLSSRYLGIDPDDERVKLASQIYPEHAFKTFDKDRIPAQDGTFDYVLIIAVLHHIPNNLISIYLQEFERVLKPDGELIIIEPYICEKTRMNNRFMNWYDDGDYIRKEEDYLRLFRIGGFDCQVIHKFTKCFLYNEMFFCAKPQSKSDLAVVADDERNTNQLDPFMIPLTDNITDEYPETSTFSSEMSNHKR